MTDSEKEVLDIMLAYTTEKTLWENAMEYKGMTDMPEKMEKKPYDYFKDFDMKQYAGLTKDEIRAQYDIFFNRYTTPKKRAYGGSTHFRFPATYQGLSESDVSEIAFVNDKRCEITCKIPTGFKQTIKFIVLKKKDGWLLDSVKSYSRYEDKWSNSIL